MNKNTKIMIAKIVLSPIYVVCAVFVAKILIEKSILIGEPDFGCFFGFLSVGTFLFHIIIWIIPQKMAYFMWKITGEEWDYDYAKKHARKFGLYFLIIAITLLALCIPFIF